MKIKIVSSILVIVLIACLFFAFQYRHNFQIYNQAVNFLFGHKYPQYPRQQGDCGANPDCFTQAAQSCTPATIVISPSKSANGFENHYTITLSIKGIENTITSYQGKCVITEKYDNIGISLTNEERNRLASTGMNPDQIDNYYYSKKSELASAVGMTITYWFKPSDLIQKLPTWYKTGLSDKDLSSVHSVVTDVARHPVPKTVLLTEGNDFTDLDNDLLFQEITVTDSRLGTMVTNKINGDQRTISIPANMPTTIFGHVLTLKGIQRTSNLYQAFLGIDQ
jgi:hypothetical protein